MASAVFLNYRREDCEATVAHLYDCLCGWFGDTVYFDRHSVTPGADFPEELRQAVVGCEAMIAVIGPEWFSDVNQKRLMDPKDWVRREIELALSNGKLVIPLLVEVAGKSPFQGRKLPTSIMDLARKNWVKIDHPSMPGDAFDTIRKELESQGIEPVPRPAAAETARRQVEALLAQPQWLVQWLENRKSPEILANAYVICRENVARLEQLANGVARSGNRDAALLTAAERLKAASQGFARELGVLGGSAYAQASPEFGSLRFLVSRRSELWADKEIHTSRMARFHPGLAITPVEVHSGDGGVVRVKRVSSHKLAEIPKLGVGMGSFAAASGEAAIKFLTACPVPIAVLHEIGADLLEPVREFLMLSSHKLALVALSDSRRCHVLGPRGQDLWFQDNLACEDPVIMVFSCPWGRVVVGLGISHNHHELLRLVEPQILLMPCRAADTRPDESAAAHRSWYGIGTFAANCKGPSFHVVPVEDLGRATGPGQQHYWLLGGV